MDSKIDLVHYSGLEMLLQNKRKAQGWGRCGLVSNQASIDRNFIPTWKHLKDLLGDRLTALFGPQHGFVSTVQDNMIESPHAKHPLLGIPIYSLYSETREPTEEMLTSVDTIIVDLQIVGTRIYTYKYTMAACLRAAKKFSKKVVVLDRANPLGGVLCEGAVLKSEMKSFVGEFSIPMRHGLTAGEAARFFNQEIQCDLQVVKLERWDPYSMVIHHHRPWVLPSPNLPSPESVLVYPGLVLLEATNISEGRGTCLPFQFVGAPYVDNPEVLVDYVKKISHGAHGVHLRPTSFEPCFSKWSGKTCNGFQIHPILPKKIASYSLGLAVIRAFIELYPNHFKWKQPPYEYEHHRLPINIMMGMPDADQKFFAKNFDVLDSYWTDGLSDYLSLVSSSLLYDRPMAAHSII